MVMIISYLSHIMVNNINWKHNSGDSKPNYPANPNNLCHIDNSLKIQYRSSQETHACRKHYLLKSDHSVDLEKALNMVRRYGMKLKMWKYGIAGRLFMWFTSVHINENPELRWNTNNATRSEPWEKAYPKEEYSHKHSFSSSHLG